MVLWMPVSSPEHNIEFSFFAQFVDDRECRFVFLDTETTACAKVVLHVDNYECCL